MKIIWRLAPTMRISLVPLFQLCSTFVILSRGHKWSAFLIDFVHCLIVHFSFFSFSVLTNIKLTWHIASFDNKENKGTAHSLFPGNCKNTFPEPQYKCRQWQLLILHARNITLVSTPMGQWGVGQPNPKNTCLFVSYAKDIMNQYMKWNKNNCLMVNSRKSLTKKYH